MNILLTNDDGIEAGGLWSLYDAFIGAGHDVWIVAPRQEQSARSHAITTREPLRVSALRDQVYAVTGTPADCVIMAFEHLLLNAPPIDLVVSGINAGQNLGDDIFYSGTFAAAAESSFYGIKSIAISTTGHSGHKYDTAAQVLLYLLDKGIMDFLCHRELVNINVPNVSFSDIQGYVVCQTGHRRYQNIVHIHKDHRGSDIFWLGGDQPLIDKSNYEVDAFAIQENKVSISPILVDLNDYKKMPSMTTWCDSFQGDK